MRARARAYVSQKEGRLGVFDDLGRPLLEGALGPRIARFAVAGGQQKAPKPKRVGKERPTPV